MYYVQRYLRTSSPHFSTRAWPSSGGEFFIATSSEYPAGPSEVAYIATINASHIGLVTDNRRLIPKDWKTLFVCPYCVTMMCSKYSWGEIERWNKEIYRTIIDYLDYHHEVHAFRPVVKGGRTETQEHTEETPRDMDKKESQTGAIQSQS